MAFETVACCDDCWWVTKRQLGFSEVGIKLPRRMRQEMRRKEFCHFCGWTTFSGIYVRTDTDAERASPLRIRKEY